MSYFIGSNRLYDEDSQKRNNLLLSNLITASGGPTPNEDFVLVKEVKEKTLSEKLFFLENESIISEEIIQKTKEQLDPKTTLKEFMDRNFFDDESFGIDESFPIFILENELLETKKSLLKIKAKKDTPSSSWRAPG